MRGGQKLAHGLVHAQVAVHFAKPDDEGLSGVMGELATGLDDLDAGVDYLLSGVFENLVVAHADRYVSTCYRSRR